MTFTSVNYQLDTRAQQQQGVNCFQVYRELYHLQGSLRLAANHQLRYAQLFFYDPAFAGTICYQQNPQLNVDILQYLLEMLHAYNPFIQVYLTAQEQLQ